MSSTIEINEKEKTYKDYCNSQREERVNGLRRHLTLTVVFSNKAQSRGGRMEIFRRKGQREM